MKPGRHSSSLPSGSRLVIQEQQLSGRAGLGRCCAAYLDQQRLLFGVQDEEIGCLILPGRQMMPDGIVIRQSLEIAEGAQGFSRQDAGGRVGENVGHQKSG